MATGLRRSAALARAEAHLSRARVAGRGRQNRIQSPPETPPSLLDGLPLSRHPERSLSSPSRDPSPRSLIRSLDELFSEAAGTPSDASTSNDFRVNVLSLDELVPVAASEKEDLKEGSTEQAPGTPSGQPGTAPIPAAPRGAFRAFKASAGKPRSLETESGANPDETDVSEQLSDASGGPSPSTEGETPGSPEYSEDFESDLSSALAEATVEESSSSGGGEKSCGRWDASLLSRRSGLSCSGRRKPRRHRTTRDASVQTSFPLFPDQGVWSAAEVPFARGKPVGPSSPVASHVPSPEIMEAMATSSPATLALNEMLKHHLLLIQNFAEASRRLHASVVASLDEEKFHYHTLEEAKQYISRHRPPRLTVEQVLQELGQDRAGREPLEGKAGP